jgi:hypothetical protein
VELPLTVPIMSWNRRIGAVPPKGGHLVVSCAARRTYGRNLPSPWVAGQLVVHPEELPTWTADEDQEHAHVVLDPDKYRRAAPQPDWYGEGRFGPGPGYVLTLVAADIRVELGILSEAQVAALNSIYLVIGE